MITKGRIRQKQYMHRLVCPAPAHLVVDHINRDRLDNRKANLRPATTQQNAWNSEHGKNSGSSKYKGVHWVKRDQTWRAYLVLGCKNIFLGNFKDEKTAAMAYDKAAKKHRGQFAVLNFPHLINRPK